MLHEVAPCLAPHCRNDFADIPFRRVRVTKRPKACGVFEKVGDTHLVDTNSSRDEPLQGSFRSHHTEPWIRCSCGRRPWLRSWGRGKTACGADQEGASPIQIRSFLGS